jgi:hypothetical protein
MTWQRKVLFVGAAMQGHYQADDAMLDTHHGYSIAEAVEVGKSKATAIATNACCRPAPAMDSSGASGSIAHYEAGWRCVHGIGGAGTDARRSGIAGVAGQPGGQPPIH